MIAQIKEWDSVSWLFLGFILLAIAMLIIHIVNGDFKEMDLVYGIIGAFLYFVICLIIMSCIYWERNGAGGES